jgi:hypothetical protein
MRPQLVGDLFGGQPKLLDDQAQLPAVEELVSPRRSNRAQDPFTLAAQTSPARMSGDEVTEDEVGHLLTTMLARRFRGVALAPIPSGANATGIATAATMGR